MGNASDAKERYGTRQSWRVLSRHRSLGLAATKLIRRSTSEDNRLISDKQFYAGRNWLWHSWWKTSVYASCAENRVNACVLWLMPRQIGCLL